MLQMGGAEARHQEKRALLSELFRLIDQIAGEVVPGYVTVTTLVSKPTQRSRTRVVPETRV